MIKFLLGTSYALIDLLYVQEESEERAVYHQKRPRRGDPIALNRAKDLAIRRVQVLCDVMEAIQAINGCKDWALISIIALI